MKRFLLEDDGAMTIDWAALAAGVMMVSVGTVGLLIEEVQFVVDEIEEEIVASLDVTPPSETSAGGGDDGTEDTDAGNGGDDGDDGTTTVDAPSDSPSDDDGPNEACDGTTCYIDDDGDGVSDRRRDGNGTVHDDGGVILANVN
ncbi:MAG: hypothetical protein AAF968_03640 [Pseudomonadota bacterium]